MKLSTIIAVSVISGAVVTLITGVIPNVPIQLLGASWYGYPIEWLIKLVVAPQYNPWKIIYPNLIIDLIFWIIAVAIVMLAAKLILALKHPTKNRKTKKKSKR